MRNGVFITLMTLVSGTGWSCGVPWIETNTAGVWLKIIVGGAVLRLLASFCWVLAVFKLARSWSRERVIFREGTSWEMDWLIWSLKDLSTFGNFDWVIFTLERVYVRESKLVTIWALNQTAPKTGALPFFGAIETAVLPVRVLPSRAET